MDQVHIIRFLVRNTHDLGVGGEHYLSISHVLLSMYIVRNTISDTISDVSRTYLGLYLMRISCHSVYM